jgi:UDP-N-acetylmuramoyl-L-alanyl-D-glutamate--2,6-diaminopimelate ligase
VVMEVSSHSLAQHRVYGLKFGAATFTNLTQDHLDYHHSMDEYFRAKKMLFDDLSPSAVAVTNVDDARGLQIIADTKAKPLTFGIGRGEISAHDLSLTMTNTSFSVARGDTVNSVTSTLIGRFNVQNILAAYATAVGLGIKPTKVVDGIAKLKSVRGRFEQIASPKGWVAIVDYAHTPDGLENCLRAIHDAFPKVDDSTRRGRIICVFGAGGNRDKTKRPLMGRVASELSDVTVITSDNPRLETPEDIVKDIQAGIPPTTTVIVEIDRRKAIHLALAMAKSGDVVLIAGKGHEDYQVLGEKKIHFDDREEVENFIRNAV